MTFSPPPSMISFVAFSRQMRERQAHQRLLLCPVSQGRAESGKLVLVRCFVLWAWIDPCTRGYLPALEAIFEEGSGSDGQPRVGLSWLNIVLDLDLQESLKSKIRAAGISNTPERSFVCHSRIRSSLLTKSGWRV